METLLFIANLSPTVGDLFNELSKSFSVKLVPYDWTQISKIIETTSPTKAVIYVKDLSQDETTSLHTFLQDSEKSKMPLLCIGSKDEIKKQYTLRVETLSESSSHQRQFLQFWKASKTLFSLILLN